LFLLKITLLISFIILIFQFSTKKMSILLFSLRNVPDDESSEIKDLLDTNEINYFETSAGNWGVSMPALWLKNNDELEKAQKLLNEYHIQRAKTQRKVYEELKQERKNKSLLDAFIENPIKYLIYLAAIAFMLFLYPKMLFEFGL